MILVIFLIGTQDAFAMTRDILFPVAGTAAFQDDFHDPRGGGTRVHLGVDILADKMTPLLAANDGKIVYLVSPEASWGYAITLQDADGYQYRYLHVNNDTPGTDDGNGGELHAYAPGITPGTKVVRGQLIGWVGDSGNAETITSHLHFELREPGNRVAVNPYDSLVAAASSSKLIAIKDIGHHVGSAEPVAGTGDAPEFHFTKKLMFGQKSEDVRQLQLKLKSLGYLSGVTATGYFGSLTKKAVQALQRDHGLEQVGYVGPGTRALLNRS